MASQLQDVQIELGGRSLTLRYSIKATLALKERWGLDNDREVQARMAKATMAEFIDIVWAGLRTHHKEITHDEVVDMLDDAGAEGLTDMVTAALEASVAPDDNSRPRAGQPDQTPSR